jgi:hypothetical protein
MGGGDIALDGDEWSAPHPNCSPLGERDPGTHWIGDWLGPSAVLDAVEKRKIFPHRQAPRPSSL